ncbi:hypothetical protein [Streptomyces platensis]|uniref:hypothetical protein n=1 Tax=Streptomyces platensis TaxID=58346 RepID=UPI0037B1E738
MNTLLIKAAADLICRTMRTYRTPAGIAAALDAAGMLQSPEAAAELEQLRASVAELESTAGRRRIAWQRARTRARAAGGAADRCAAQAAELQLALQDTVGALLAGQLEREVLRARVAELEQQTADVSPWQRAVDGLNALVDADLPVHVEPDGHISNPAGSEHIEWDRSAGRWLLVHDDEAAEVPLTAEQAEARRLDYRATMRAAGGDLP